MTTVLVPRPPVGCTEQPPMRPGEVVRWMWSSPAGFVAVILAIRHGIRFVELMTGPGTHWPATSDPADTGEWSLMLHAAWVWQYGDLPAAERPTDQLGLFDEEAVNHG